MQIYEYKCPSCGYRVLTGARGDRHLAACLNRNCEYFHHEVEHLRVFSVQVQRPMAEHWNNTVNEPVSSMHGFKEALKRKGEEYTARTGIDVNYQPVDVTDREAVGATEEGLEPTRRRMHAEGHRASEKLVL